jgi:hypothetical protein
MRLAPELFDYRDQIRQPVPLRIDDFGARVPGTSQALTSISMKPYKDLQAVSATGFLPLGF